MLSILSKGPFTCINCGQGRSSTVYRVYGKKENDDVPVTHMKLTQCPSCEKYIDDYVELDSCILFLDALLQRPRFYRHVLINCNLTNRLTVKFFMVLLLSDTIFSWSRVQIVNGGAGEVTYVDLEFAFYRTFIRSLLENVIFLFCLMLHFKCYVQFFDREVPDKEVLQAIIYASFVKVFKMLTILWVSEFQTPSIIMLDVLHGLSISQSLNVVLNRNRSKFMENDAQNQGKEVKPFKRIPLIFMTASSKLFFLSFLPYFF